jgi:hypothetical protein
MRKYILILIGFLSMSFVATPQNDSVSKKVKDGESMTVNVKFGDIPLSPSQVTKQQNALFENSIKTTETLSTNIQELTLALQQGILVARQSKIDKVADQLNVNEAVIFKALKKNNIFKIIALIPTLVFVLWAMGKFLLVRGLEISKAIKGTLLMAVYAGIFSVTLYFVLSLIFNSQFFMIKELITSFY